MADHSKSYVYKMMADTFVIPLFFEADFEKALAITKACARGGANVIEYTQRGEGALETFEKLAVHCRQHLGDVILGAGSIGDDLAASDFINAGANFIVSPFFNIEIALFCQEQDIPYFPGCATATEIVNAESHGIEVCKIFPAAQIGGPSFIKAIKAPMPSSKLMPTGGVKNSPEDLKAWYDAGAYCVGMGSTLLSADLLKKGDYDGITQMVKNTLEIVRNFK